MNPETTIEAVVASPPERDELVVQLFFKNGAQWGEIYREDGAYRIDVFARDPVLQFDADELAAALARSLTELRSRLEE